MHDALRRFATIGVVFVMTAALFYAWRSRDNGYGLIDILKGTPPPQPALESSSGSYTTPDKPVIDLHDVQVLNRLNKEYTTLIESVRPSVVSINTTKLTSTPHRVYLTPGLYFQQDETVEEPGLGSGVIVSEEGHIVTNYHVIRDVDDIRITTSDGQDYKAALVGSAQGIDIAVLQIVDVPEGITFSALSFGDSSKVRAGEMVFAVGNPFGLGETITQGIISALPRRVSDSAFETFQTDAVINPGNSGGPLISITGQVIGINYAIYTAGNSQVQSWQGVSFAIPSNDVRRTFESIMKSGHSLEGFLGIATRDLSYGDKHKLGIQDGRGILITGVKENSPASEAGLQAGDVLLSFGREPMADSGTLFREISTHPIGKKTEIGIIRQGRRATLTTTVGDRSEYVSAESATKNQRISEALGIEVRNLSLIQRHRLGMRNLPGIEVTAVLPGSLVQNKINKGDIIFQLNGIPIYNTVQFYQALDQLPFDEKAHLRFFHNGRSYAVPFTPRVD